MWDNKTKSPKRMEQTAHIWANIRPEDPAFFMYNSQDASLCVQPRGFSLHAAEISFTQITAAVVWPLDTVFVDTVKTCCLCSEIISTGGRNAKCHLMYSSCGQTVGCFRRNSESVYPFLPDIPISVIMHKLQVL